jgi:hypothetical protein
MLVELHDAGANVGATDIDGENAIVAFDDARGARCTAASQYFAIPKTC